MKWTIISYFILLTLTNSILIGKLLSDISYNFWLASIFTVIQAILFFVFYNEVITKAKETVDEE